MLDKTQSYFEIFLKSGQTIALNGTASRRYAPGGVFLGFDFDHPDAKILSLDESAIVAVVQHD
jgi:hypothetical protein